jgi:hypothetical protein
LASVPFFFRFLELFIAAHAQVNTVEFGKNRVQYQKFNWKYYQTENFNTYFSQDGLELGKYVAQVAEKELPQLEEFVEYGSQRRINLVVYNNYDEIPAATLAWASTGKAAGGLTKLVNNKMMLYFDGNHENLRRQIRQGIANVLVQTCCLVMTWANLLPTKPSWICPNGSPMATSNTRPKPGAPTWTTS